MLVFVDEMELFVDVLFEYVMVVLLDLEMVCFCVVDLVCIFEEFFGVGWVVVVGGG